MFSRGAIAGRSVAAALRARYASVFSARAAPTAVSAQPSAVDRCIAREEARQRNQLILIPSESACLPESASAASSVFGNIYAEGTSDLRLARHQGPLSQDESMFTAWQNRLSDGRFYRGCIEANRVENLAKTYIAQAFSLLPGSPTADKIHVCIQGLSGGPANLAIYQAILKQGDHVVALDLTHGGHLSHGSPYNVSGKFYNVKYYGVDPSSRVINYDAIRELVRAHKPKVLIAGASAYPWDFEWDTLRSIAHESGALLMADCAHLAGLVVGGQLNNPLAQADIVMFTTHKTLLGPRGAAIVTGHLDLAKKIELAIFPGMQGGPHMNAIAGIAKHFETIIQNRDDYCKFQREVIRTAGVLCEAMRNEGLTIEYGGTSTHLFLVDLKPLKTVNGGYLDGETASRLLENVGIVCNKNTLPGDKTSADASGLRFSTTWLVQRGVTDDQLKQLAKTTRELLQSASPFAVWAPAGDEKCRAKVPFGQIMKAREEIAAISHALPYPGFQQGDDLVDKPAEPKVVTKSKRAGLLLRGDKVRLALQDACSTNLYGLRKGEATQTLLLDPQGNVIDDVVVVNLGCGPNTVYGTLDEEKYAVFPHRDKFQNVGAWFQSLSDGFVSISDSNLYGKVNGPFAVSTLDDSSLTDLVDATSKAVNKAELVDHTKTFFIGQESLNVPSSLKALPSFQAPQVTDIRKTVLHDWHERQGAKMVNFAGWHMPVEYKDGIFKEHAAVRCAAGLFDVSHMAAIGVYGENALPFLEETLANFVSRLENYEAQYSYMLREDGTALDDLYVYRIARDNFMIVVNASNFDADYAWLNAVNNGEVCIDAKNPHRRIAGPVKLQALRDAGEKSLVGFAFQGPLSGAVLAELADSDADKATILGLQLNMLADVKLKGVAVRVAATGYTGSPVGFEVFMHPDKAEFIWQAILDQGESRGVRPIGLGARDSLRIEAGFPLFGHELEGPENLSLTEADYGFVTRLHHPFFIGRDAYIDRLQPSRKKRLLRLEGSGRKSVRAGHAIVDSYGKVVGTVTSAAFNSPNFDFCALAAVDADFHPKAGTTVRAVRANPEQVKQPVDEKKVVELNVRTRFPVANEKAAWPEMYAGWV